MQRSARWAGICGRWERTSIDLTSVRHLCGILFVAEMGAERVLGRLAARGGICVT